MLIIREVISSELAIGDDLTEGLLHGLLLSETLRLDELAIVSGDVWETWAFNGVTFEASVYSGFAFNSYADDDEQIYAANENGIYVLSGDTDAGSAIHSGVVLSPSMFGLMNRKRFRQAFLDVTGAMPVLRGEIGGGVGVSLPIVRSRAMFPRSLVGNKWTFLIADFNELGRVELFPVVLTR